MPNEIRTKLDALTSFTITLSALASNAANQSALVTNSSLRPAALVYVAMIPTSAPTAGTIYEVFLLRGNGIATEADDGATVGANPITIVNAQLIGTLVVNGANIVKGIFDTAPLGPLGTQWGIAVRNSTNVAVQTGALSLAKFQTYLPEIQ